ncbi:MAG: hypothetical protein ACXWF1_01165 [Chthoniobacterales bacterium]
MQKNIAVAEVTSLAAKKITKSKGKERGSDMTFPFSAATAERLATRNPNNFAKHHVDIFPGIVSANLLCLPRELNLRVAGLRELPSAREGILPNE